MAKTRPQGTAVATPPAARPRDVGSAFAPRPPLCFCLVAVGPRALKKQRGLSDEGNFYLGMARPGWKVNFRLTGWAAGSPKNLSGGREEAAGGCDPSSGASSGPRCLPEATRSTATPCMRKMSLFQLIIGTPTRTDYLKCINGRPEECFIIEVIAVFSRLTFAGGVHWNHHRLSYLWEKFYLSEASDICEHRRPW